MPNGAPCCRTWAMNTLIVSLSVRLHGSLEMKWAPVVPAFMQQRQQKAVSYFPHSTLGAVLHYVSQRETWLCMYCLSVTVYLQARLSRVDWLWQLAPMWKPKSEQCQPVWSHCMFECGDLLCGSTQGLDFCVLVSLCWFSSCELPSSSLSFFVCSNPLLPLPSVPDCFASQSCGVLVSSCCWSLSSDRLDRTDFWQWRLYAVSSVLSKTR